MAYSVKYLFLDIDGVLNSDDWYSSEEYNDLVKRDLHKKGHIPDHHIDSKAVRLLSDFLREYPLDVIISSSWRLHYSLDEIKEILKLKGFRGKIVDRTEMNIQKDKTLPRGWLIANYIQGKKIKPGEIIIFDDKNNMNDLNHRFILTNGKHGLTEEDIQKAKKKIK